MPQPLLSNPAVRELIKMKARKLSRVIHQPSVDTADLEQYLIMAVLEACRSFDPQRGSPEAYAATVIRRAASRYKRDRWAQKRIVTIWPIDVDTIADPDVEREQARTDLRLILTSFLSSLTPDQQILARKLMEQSPSELAHEMGIPRSTLHSRIRALRQPFEKEYLAEFL